MKKYLPYILACTALLAACAGTPDSRTQYSIETSVTDSQRLEDLEGSIQRVLESRIIAMGEFPRKVEVSKQSGGFNAEVTLSGSNTEIFTTLTEKLTEPLTIVFMVQTPLLEEADVIIADTEGFNETLLNEEHVDWLTAKVHPVLKTGEVTINFTEAGMALKKQIFAEHKDENVGIFVRNRPVYKMKVEEDDIEADTLILRNIPSVDMAQIFADDLNTGLHVTFTPIQ